MSDVNQQLALEEFEIESFVTSMHQGEQDAVVGGWSTNLCWAVSGYITGHIVDGLITRGVQYMEENYGNTETAGGGGTDPGFFDGSYPCG